MWCHPGYLWPSITPLGYAWQEERLLRCNNLRDLIFSSCQRGCLRPARGKVGSLLSQRPDDMTSARRRPCCCPLAVPPQLISPLCRPAVGCLGAAGWGLGCLSVHGLPEERSWHYGRHVEFLQLVSETIVTSAPWSGQGPRPYQSCCYRHVCSFVLGGPVYLCAVAGGLSLLSSSPENRRLESGRCDGNNWSLSSFCSMFTFCALVCHEPCWAQVLLFARRYLSVGFFFCLTSLLTLLVHGQATRLVRLVFVTSIQLIVQFPRHSQGPFFVERSLPQKGGALNSIRNYSARNTLKKTNHDILYFYFSYSKRKCISKLIWEKICPNKACKRNTWQKMLKTVCILRSFQFFIFHSVAQPFAPFSNFVNPFHVAGATPSLIFFHDSRRIHGTVWRALDPFWSCVS